MNIFHWLNNDCLPCENKAWAFELPVSTAGSEVECCTSCQIYGVLEIEELSINTVSIKLKQLLY